MLPTLNVTTQKMSAVLLKNIALGKAGKNFGAASKASSAKDPQIPIALAVVYKSVEELANDAEYIAEIEVQSADVLLRLPPLSLSNVKIITPLKGDLKADDVITVAEEGAMATEGRDAVIVGAPVLNMGNRYVLFLNKYEDNYIVLGVYQGKFIEREGYVFQQSTDDIKTDAFAPVTIEEFMANVRRLVGS